jgi:hypothetical protein
MRTLKPQQIPARNFVLRPSKPLTGNYTVGFGIEAMSAVGVAHFSWCGSKRQVHMTQQLKSYMTSFRLPSEMSPDDLYVLSVSAPFMLVLSVDVVTEGHVTEDVLVEAVDDVSGLVTLCEKPATEGRPFSDPLIIGEAPVAAKRKDPVGRIESLRELPDGGVLHLKLHRRPNDSRADFLNVVATLGDYRRVCVVPPGLESNATPFRLRAQGPGEGSNLTLDCHYPFLWSCVADRGWDLNCLPVFSFNDSVG